MIFESNCNFNSIGKLSTMVLNCTRSSQFLLYFDEGTDGEGADRPRRRYNRRFQRRRRPGQRRQRESGGEGEGDGKKDDTSDKDGSESEGEGKDRRRNRQRRFKPRRSRQPTIFVGGLPRSLRVSTFKTEVRGKDVDPLRVVWYGGSGHAFLQFQNSDLMESALEALADLDINGKKLRVEEAHQNRGGGRNKSEGEEGTANGDATNEEKDQVKQEVD